MSSTSTLPALAAAVDKLRDPRTIRARCAAIHREVAAGRSSWFTLAGDDRLNAAAERVVRVTRERYPTLEIPYHSRWRHFEAGGIDRSCELSHGLARFDAAEQARSRIDLAMVSVLLDAGAGAAWKFVETESGATFARSEGLAVASLRAFERGVFSSDPARPLQVDGRALAAIDASALAHVFQVSAGNPLVGLEGRAAVLRRLGAALIARPQTFGTAARPGFLFDLLTRNGGRHEVAAASILRALLDHCSSIWLTANRLGDEPLGDVWPHTAAREHGRADAADLSAGWVPFHKLSQWLAYSLFEPFEWAGVKVIERDALTALPEYRNGGLLLDTGVVVPRDPGSLRTTWRAGDPPIVEWRALTVALIDDLAVRVRAALQRTAAEMPLACVLEGGTWAAGRALAQELRGGLPPLDIESDGTVF
ncbi:MAG TPA: URC4/urg3 family protein [Burkholderiaceae bacterium]|nr:URC4/urg3 family protein [Burkholderiaceae bacterium]